MFVNIDFTTIPQYHQQPNPHLFSTKTKYTETT